MDGGTVLTTKYEQLAGPVLVFAGSFMIWLRAIRKFPDWMLPVIGGACALVIYLIVHIFTSDWRWEVLAGLSQVVTWTGAIIAGTATAARVAAARTDDVLPKNNTQ